MWEINFANNWREKTIQLKKLFLVRDVALNCSRTFVFVFIYTKVAAFAPAPTPATKFEIFRGLVTWERNTRPFFAREGRVGAVLPVVNTLWGWMLLFNVNSFTSRPLRIWIIMYRQYLSSRISVRFKIIYSRIPRRRCLRIYLCYALFM